MTLEKIIIPPSPKMIRFIFFIFGLGILLMLTNVWGIMLFGLFFIFLGVLVLFTLKRIELTPIEVSASGVLTGKIRSFSSDDVEEIRITDQIETSAHKRGLMKRGEVITIINSRRKSIRFLTPYIGNVNTVMAFLEKHYGDKIIYYRK
jgi:hypothetical protein